MGLVFLTTGLANADSPKPDWLTKFQSEDATYRYYLGRSSGAPNEATGVSEATRDAISQAITENFGFKTRVSKDTYEGSDKTSVTNRFQEISRNVEMRGWEQAGFFIEKDGNRFNVWVLYKYRKTDVAREKQRLATVKEEEEKTIRFTEAGDSADKHNGGIEVTTRPVNGAQILIDGKPLSFLQTPLRMFGIPPGSHTLRIEHSKFEPIEEMVVIAPGTVKKLSKKLVKASGKVSVTSSPSNANVMIDGKPVGVTPIEGAEVPAGESVKIELSHAEAQSESRTTQVERDASRTEHFELPLKPAFIESIVTRQPGVSISIDGKPFGISPLLRPIEVEPGKLIPITFEKEGFYPERIEVSLRGGERRRIPTIRLKSIAEEEKRQKLERAEEERRAKEEAEREAKIEAERRERIKNPKIILGAYYGIGASTLQAPDYPVETWAVRAQYMPFRWLGFVVDIIRTGSSAEYSDATVSTTGIGAVVGAIVFLSESIYLSPQWIYLGNRVSANYSTGTSSAVSSSQQGAGLAFGGKWWLNAEDSNIRIGLMGEAGVHFFYTTTGGLAGSTPTSVKFGMLVGF